MGRSSGLVAVGVLIGALVLAPPAHADTWVNGYLGAVFGGSTGEGFAEALDNENTVTYGVGLGTMGTVVGAEVDFAHTPNFFGKGDPVDSTSITTVHGTLLLGIPIGGGGAGVRPYAAIGLGAIRQRVAFTDLLESISTSELGYNVGLGIMGFFSDTFGLRAEYRYFRNFQENDEFLLRVERGPFSFSRASAGLVIRF